MHGDEEFFDLVQVLLQLVSTGCTTTSLTNPTATQAGKNLIHADTRIRIHFLMFQLLNYRALALDAESYYTYWLIAIIAEGNYFDFLPIQMVAGFPDVTLKEARSKAVDPDPGSNPANSTALAATA